MRTEGVQLIESHWRSFHKISIRENDETKTKKKQYHGTTESRRGADHQRDGPATSFGRLHERDERRSRQRRANVRRRIAHRCARESEHIGRAVERGDRHELRGRGKQRKAGAHAEAAERGSGETERRNAAVRAGRDAATRRDENRPPGREHAEFARPRVAGATRVMPEIGCLEKGGEGKVGAVEGKHDIAKQQPVSAARCEAGH